MNHRAIVTLVLVACGLALCCRQSEAAVACESLVRFSLADSTVTEAQSVAAGAFVPPASSSRNVSAAQRQAFAGLPAFCRVAMTSRPSSDSDIRIEVWLPAAGWNRRLQAVGDGGLAGFIPYASMAAALAQGYVAAGTDTGHVGGNADFMPGHPEKLIDFNVVRTVGAEAERSLALFMLPGVTHCGGGTGPDTFDKMAAISEWVEQGGKPSRIVASRLREGRVDRTRPLCAFGQVARYSGRGSTDDAKNFSCQAVPAADRTAR